MEKTSGISTVAVSLAHSDRIPIGKLNGQPVPLLEPFLDTLADSTRLKKIYVIPLLMVNGGAIYTKLSESIKSFRTGNPNKIVALGDTLVNRLESGPVSIPAIIARGVESEIRRVGLDGPEVLIVDHGSPFPVAAGVRDWVASEVEMLLPKGTAQSVLGASMERRDGAQYEFNEPLLEHALEDCANRGVRDVLVAKMLIQPGKHSGKKGDIDQIIDSVSDQRSRMRVHIVRQIFQQKDLVLLLTNRLKKLVNDD